MSAPPAAPSRSIALTLALVVIAILGGGALFIAGFALGAQRATTPGTPADEERAFQPFWDTYRAITDTYAGGPVDRKTLVDGAIRGMIGALNDPYSAYLSPAELRRSLEGMNGAFEGIGARTEVRRLAGSGDCAKLGKGCALIVVEPIAGSPAEVAGLLTGDRITAVDGTTLDGLTAADALARIRGPKGTSVTLSITRGTGAPFEMTIVRDVIVAREVETKTLADGTVGYIRLAGFSDRAADDVAAAIRSDLGAGRRKLILDLRGNPGGFVTDAQKVISQFVPGGTTIFWQQDASGANVPSTSLPGGAATDPGIDVIVLIDGGTASASEITAGALQDLGRARLVGTQSFGKGTIQSWLQLPDDNGGFRLTVAKWLTPDKRWIHGTGLQPDVPVDLSKPALAGSDPILTAALDLLGGGARRGPTIFVAPLDLPERAAL